jgi:dihydrofolate reductase
MRPVVLYALLSVDGVAESPDAWLFDFDEVMHANLAEVIGAQDAVLLGRRMHDEWADYWPSAEDEPFATFINSVRKYVFTASEPTQDWTAVTVCHGDVVAQVEELKRQPGGAIGLHGSIALSQSLLRAGLVDELRLVVAPATAGSGRRLFPDGELQRWDLLDAVATPSGALLLGYRRRSAAAG